MTGAGRFPGQPFAHAFELLVLALIDGEFANKRSCVVGAGIVLLAENPRFINMEISAETGPEFQGGRPVSIDP